MSPFDRGFASSAPVCIMSPQPAHQYHDQIANPAFPFASNFSAPPAAILPTDFRNSRAQAQQQTPPPPIMQQAPPTRPQNASRKRSRDDADLNEEVMDLPPSSTVSPIRESEDEWVYGPGMTLIKPNQGYVADATSQSGTWVEERATADAAAAAAAQSQQQQRPSIRSTKSQRLDGIDTSGFAFGSSTRSSSPGKNQSQHSQQSQYGVSPTSSSISLATTAADLGNPIVDNFTMHLGIGWSAIAEGPKQAAARGWARYIENHYPLTGVALRLESRGLESYLVEADQGFFLFAEDLRKARLVSRDPSRALENLQRNPPVFDEEGTLCAGESPSHAAGAGTPAAEMVYDMDMS